MGLRLTWLLIPAFAALPALADDRAPWQTGPVTTAAMESLGQTHYRLLRSRLLEHDYHIYVRLPETYAEIPERRYPTVYLLDGGVQFPMLASYYHNLIKAEEIPELIVVGISYGTEDFRAGNNRSHDYSAPAEGATHWGGASCFQTFLAEELIPMIESRYRAMPDRRIIVGQSMGGQFVLFTALTRPELFWGHLAGNPALHRNLAFFLKPPAATGDEAMRPRVFVASASHDNPRFRGPALEWMNHWTAAAEKPFDLRAVTLQGHSHFSTPPLLFRDGLRWLFAEPAAP